MFYQSKFHHQEKTDFTICSRLVQRGCCHLHPLAGAQVSPRWPPTAGGRRCIWNQAEIELHRHAPEDVVEDFKGGFSASRGDSVSQSSSLGRSLTRFGCRWLALPPAGRRRSSSDGGRGLGPACRRCGRRRLATALSQRFGSSTSSPCVCVHFFLFCWSFSFLGTFSEEQSDSAFAVQR